MQERVTTIGGTITIVSRPGAGTSIRARIPLAPAAGGAVTPTVYAQQ